MKDTLRRDGETGMNENYEAGTKFWWDEAQSFYSKIMLPKFKIGAFKSAILFCIVMFSGAFFATQWLDISIFTGAPFLTSKNHKIAYQLECTTRNATQTCPANNPMLFNTDDSSAHQCPEYFRWIYEDLRSWKRTGITKEIVESGIHKASLRIIVVDGKLYVEKYRDVFQTRDVFTIWGLLQLLKLYPGKLPDLDFMFQCGDTPVIPMRDYMGANASVPPPLFHYCGDDSTLDLVFPDWSFWGWPELNIRPWVSLKNEMKNGNKRIKWRKRKPFAYWKGNAWVSKNRRDLMKCNVTNKNDWNARLYQVASLVRNLNLGIIYLIVVWMLIVFVSAYLYTYYCCIGVTPVSYICVPLYYPRNICCNICENWGDESKKGFKQTNLANQCTHRYKIYIEGRAWSVSEKYILACDSMALLVKPRYYDFFTRSLQPLVHYWPVNNNNKCRSVKFAVDWGNSHQRKAQRIGKAGSSFIQEGLDMKNVYDYMFHTLNEYAKLMKYKPAIPPKAVEVCSETMACSEHEDVKKRFKIESMVKNPSDSSPCILAPPYSRNEVHAIKDKQQSVRKQVEVWEGSGDVRKVNF